LGDIRKIPRSPDAEATHLGVIDVGSNAIRLQVARLLADGTFRVIHDEREPVRLGDEVFRSGRLSDDAAARALLTLSRFSSKARLLGVESVRAVATSAVREAENGAHFARKVQQATGVDLQVISGLEEAALIARGVLPVLSGERSRMALVDIGGGSTEISVLEDGAIGFSRSLDLGAIRLTARFCASDPILAAEEAALRDHVRTQLRGADEPTLGAQSPCPTVVGSAGTIGALANYVHGRPSGPRARALSPVSFSVPELERATETLLRMSCEERRAAPGVEGRRAELIVAGAVLLEEICDLLGATTVKFVRRGLRDGLMLDEVAKLSPMEEASAFAASPGNGPSAKRDG
jgi:exopolyphosphatase/guanosine-5'-triphosphate,3'-diphosphate pyrophosphatase